MPPRKGPERSEGPSETQLQKKPQGMFEALKADFEASDTDQPVHERMKRAMLKGALAYSAAHSHDFLTRAFEGPKQHESIWRAFDTLMGVNAAREIVRPYVFPGDDEKPEVPEDK